MRLAPIAVLTLASLTLAAAPATSPAPAAKPKGGTVSGVVSGPDGKPLANATVRVAATPKETGGRFRRGPDPVKPATTKTGADGAFRLEGLPAGSLAVRVESPGLAPASADKVPSGASLTLKLKPGVAVVGRVLDLKTQRPVAGVTVRALEKEATPFGRDAAHTGTTAEDGTFKIADCAPGIVHLEAIAPAKARVRLENVLARAPKAGEVVDTTANTLFLQPGGKVSGKATGPDGKPLEGVAVTAAPTEGNLFAMFREAMTAEITDAQGRYTFEGLPAGSRYNVTGRKSGLTQDEAGPIAVDAGTDRQDVDLKLESGAAITVRLVTVEDVPVAETDARLDPSGERRGPGRGGRGGGMRFGAGGVSEEQIVAGADGKFTIKNLEAGTFDVTLSPADAADVVRESVVLKNGETVDLGTIRVKESKSISGRITDSAGQPVAGASIGTFWLDGGSGKMRDTKSRADGRYRLAGLGDTPLGEVWVNADGFAAGRKEGLVPGDTSADFTLERMGSITGRILLPEGAAPVAYKVEAHPEAKAGDGRSPMRIVVNRGQQEPKGVFSDPEGNFRLDNVEPGFMTIEARADGYAPARKSGLEVRPDGVVDAGTLTLSTGRAVRGRVVSSKDDQPISGATVSLARTQGFAMRMGGDDQEGVAITGIDGAFSVEGLEARTYTVAASQPDYSTNNGRVEVTADADVDDFVIKLSKGGTLTGTVRDAQKQPVSGANVLVTKIPMGGSPQTVSTGVDGRYTIEKMAPGDYVVIRQNPGGPVMLMAGVKQATVREGETTTFDLDEASKITLSGRVLKGGEPIANAMLMFRREGGTGGFDMRTGSSDAAGHYSIGLDEAGTYNVGVTGQNFMGGGMSGIRLEVPDQPAPVLDITVRAAGIVGKITDGEGKPITGARVTARATGEVPPGGRGRMDGMTIGDGTYAIENLPAGSYEVEAQASGFKNPPPSTVSIAGDSDRPNVDFRMETGRSFRGQVVDPQGNGISGAVVVAAPAGGIDGGGHDAGVPTRTDFNGTFVMTAPGDGAIDLTAVAPGFAAARLMSVTPREDEPVRIQTPRGGRVRVTALAADGKPAQGASVRVSAKPGFLGSDYQGMFNSSLPTGADGSSLVGPLAPGSYEIAVSQGGKRQTQAVSVTEGQEAVVSVVLP